MAMKFQIPSLSRRQIFVIIHDLFSTFLAIVATFYIRFEANGLIDRYEGLQTFIPGFVLFSGFIYFFFGLYKAKWRFASLPDLFNIFRASTVLALSLVVLDYLLVTPGFYGAFFFGKITIVLYWFIQIFFLGGPRIAYRYFRFWRTQQRGQTARALPILILGRAADAEIVLRAIESGAFLNVWPVGVLSPSPADRHQSIRAIPIIGNFSEFSIVIDELAERGIKVKRIILTPSALDLDAKPETILVQARRLGIEASRLRSLDAGQNFQIAPVAVEDLLLRPSVKIDYELVENFVRGKSVVVTGGGGSIGSEICDRAITFSAARLLVIENSEPALHDVLEILAAKNTRGVVIEGRLADIRDRARIFSLFSDFRPDLIFHAAALKHVPLLERDWGEGVKTNVLGSINVADAAAASGATAMVMISTDKAIEPVSILGATKRLAEMYCQTLDADSLADRHAGKMRFISVRFGNVLASKGSVVPKFRAQIEAGGPVTVTHQDMVRYFMTIREACDLVLTAADHALNGKNQAAVSIYVLNMGQPVRIVDLAERLIRLSGLEPGYDIEITFTGMRPGERMHEVLFAHEETVADIGLPGIVAAGPLRPSVEQMNSWLQELELGLKSDDKKVVFGVLQRAVPDFVSSGKFH